MQKHWYPQIGDIIVGCTGNIFCISAKHHLDESIGGDLFFFGGGLCSRDGGSYMNETYSSTMNKSGIHYEHGKPKTNMYHSAFNDFRFVPYPHELSRKFY